MKTTLTKKTIRDHFAYHWWMYLLAAVLSFVLVDITLSVTVPRVPEDKKVDLYICGVIDTDGLSARLEEIRASDLPEQEEINAYTILMDDNYGAMQLTTYLAAGEGDIYLLPREEFLNISASGALVALETQEDLMNLFTEKGLDLRRGWRTLRDSDETHLYGIPASFLTGLTEYAYYSEDSLLCVVSNNKNEENVMTFLYAFCREMLIPPATQENQQDDSQ